MSRLPVAAFAVLVAATVGAFFITQHLKVSTPLVGGYPAPAPAAFNPVDGRTCGGVPHRRMRISFYLLHSSDDVDVYVVDQAGMIVRTLASGLYMRGGAHPVRKLFVWNGREADGTLAPDGVYYVRVTLIHQGRTVTISNSSGPEPVRIKTVPPAPLITGIAPHLISAQGPRSVTIRYTGNKGRGGRVLIYRIPTPPARGRPRLVKRFRTSFHAQSAVWNGQIHDRPAPPGTYLIRFQVTDAACNVGSYPASIPPPPAIAPRVELTVL